MEKRILPEAGATESLRHGWRNNTRRSVAVVAVDQETPGYVPHGRSGLSRVVDFLAGGLLALGLAGTVLAFLPASLWLEVRSIQVLDSTAGVSPRMIVDRTVSQPFQGDWIVTVLEVTDEGYEPVCTAPGASDYDPENRLPNDLDLDWWTFPTQCRLDPGKYIVRTVWVIHAYPGIDKTVRAVSGIFTVSLEGDSNETSDS